MGPRLKKATKYHGLSMPASVIEAVQNHVKKPYLSEYRSVADYAIAAIREKMERDELLLLRKFYGEEVFNEMMSGNVPYEQFLKENLGFVLDDKTGKLITIDPSLIKKRKKEKEIEELEKRIAQLESKL